MLLSLPSPHTIPYMRLYDDTQTLSIVQLRPMAAEEPNSIVFRSYLTRLFTLLLVNSIFEGFVLTRK